MTAALSIPPPPAQALTWAPLAEHELEEIRALANGHRPRGEGTACGRYRLVEFVPAHPLSEVRWELWIRADVRRSPLAPTGPWAPASCWRDPDLVRAEAERLHALRTPIPAP